MKKLIERILVTYRQIRGTLFAIAYYGNKRYCPICNTSFRKFEKFGVVPREDAKCVRCGSLERHRLVWLYFKKMTDLFDGRPKKMLHVAPEKAFKHRLNKILGEGYLTADLFDPQAMVKMDITNIQYPDEKFDVIYCSHVLEHVPDDKKAMREFLRVLKPDGWAILLVPISADKSFEDPSITDPAERLKVFGQSDHVRVYGPDYVNRLIEAGFKVKISDPSDFLTEEKIVSMGLINMAGKVFYCTKK